MADDGGGRAAASLWRDFITPLHDDLLLTILLRLPTIEAIRTCVLSRRWRTLWTRLPELSFHDTDAGIRRLRFADLFDGALHRTGPGDLSSLEISVPRDGNVDAAARVPAWILAAAPRAKGRFKVLIVARQERERERVLLDLPCFTRARSVTLGLKINLELRLPGPSAGAFACLAELTLGCVHLSDGGGNLGDLLSSRCPQLERLRLLRVSGFTELSIQSEQLQELRIRVLPDLAKLDLVTPKLRVLNLVACFKPVVGMVGMTLSVRAPMLDEVGWLGFCPEVIQFNGRRNLQKLTILGYKLGTRQFTRYMNHTLFLQHFSHADLLLLHIYLPMDVIGYNKLMEEVIIPHHLELELEIDRNGHAFGSSVASLLKRCDSITKLKCSMLPSDIVLCSAGCLCDEPVSWRDERICFDFLKEMVFNGFTGTGCERDLINFIIRRGKALKAVSIAYGMRVVPIEDGRDIYKEIISSVPAGCSVVFS